MASDVRNIYRLENNLERLSGIRALAPRLPTTLHREAVSRSSANPRADSRAEELIALIPHLSGDVREEAQSQALEAIRLIDSDSIKADRLQQLFDHLTPSFQRRAVSLALDMRLVEYRVRTLARMAKGLSATELKEVTLEAHALPHPHARMHALADLVGCLSGSERIRALLALRSTMEQVSRSDIRADVVRGLQASIEHHELHPLWCDMLRSLARKHRSDLNFHLGNFADMLVAMGGPSTANEVVRSLLEVERFWP